MKKVMYAAIAALAITSCSQNEEFEAPGQKAEIGFTTAVSRSTRASELKTADLKTNDGFKIYGYSTTEDMGSTVKLPTDVFMSNVTSKWETGKWTLDPAGPYYWPTEGKIQFFAFSPFKDVTYQAPDGETAGYPSFTYAVKVVASQEDLVVAFAKNQTKEANGKSAVVLTFKHILTQVNFALKGKDAGFTYAVTNISLSGLANNGMFTYDDPANSVGTWSSTSGDASYAYDAIYPASFTTEVAPGAIATGNNALMLMPQTLGTDAKITITYSAVYGGIKRFDGTKEVSLKDVVWKAGDKILYTLSLTGGAPVTFEPTVEGWNAETDTEKEPA